MMKRLIILFMISILSGCQSHDNSTDSAECNLQRITFKSNDASKNDIYTGNTGYHVIQLYNENAPFVTTVFPDSRISIADLKSGKSCEIVEVDGIIAGQFVYADKNNHVLILDEYSGASDTLQFYNLSTCQRINEVDVSGIKWKIEKDRILKGYECKDTSIDTCTRIETVQLNEECEQGVTK